MSDPGPMGPLVLSALGTSFMSKFINMKRLDIKVGKERQFYIAKQLVHFFWLTAGLVNPYYSLNGVLLACR